MTDKEGRFEGAKKSARASGWLLMSMAVNPVVGGIAACRKSSHPAATVRYRLPQQAVAVDPPPVLRLPRRSLRQKPKYQSRSQRSGPGGQAGVLRKKFPPSKACDYIGHSRIGVRGCLFESAVDGLGQQQFGLYRFLPTRAPSPLA